MGGLTAALLLADKGCAVTVIEKEAHPGGKLRSVAVGDVRIDGGPTVFTMRHVFDQIFESIGESLDDHVEIYNADLLARHAWRGDARLDLFADQQRSRDAIGVFAGSAAARGFDSFSAEARRIYETLDGPFIRGSRTSALGLTLRIGPRQLGALWGIRPHEPMWRALGRHFTDVRLRQLFGRYATYAGSSPFHAPATLMLIAHAEASGVGIIRGGMHRLAEALAARAQARGAQFRYRTACTAITPGAVSLDTGERLSADAVIANCDPAALSSGLFGSDAARAVARHRPDRRALSAFVSLVSARTSSASLTHHNVFFSDDYPAEFAAIANGQLPPDPTVYVCAQDRPAHAEPIVRDHDRFQFIINAPANGDSTAFTSGEIAQCERATLERLKACGVTLEILDRHLTTPQEFNRLFPATGGALYGQATHGAMAAFRRPGARTRMKGLYLTGGGTHPGAGVPMAALSGIQAASACLADRASIRQSYPVATPGGTSTRRAMRETMD